ncbi:MAG: hypothetical protein ACR2NW_06110, partial [Thermodesulfobacteriota bacterium]
MKFLNISLLILMTFYLFNFSVQSQGADKTFVVEDGLKMTAEVIKIDKKKRKVTLKGKEGKI